MVAVLWLQVLQVPAVSPNLAFHMTQPHLHCCHLPCRCNPFDLTISNAHLQQGFNKIYDWNLAASLRNIFSGHIELWRNARPPLRPDLVASATTIRAFDEAITIHSFGKHFTKA